eukprot:6727499-Pyramimonas_sp.AAC.1
MSRSAPTSFRSEGRPQEGPKTAQNKASRRRRWTQKRAPIFSKIGHARPLSGPSWTCIRALVGPSEGPRAGARLKIDTKDLRVLRGPLELSLIHISEPTRPEPI